MTLAFFYLIRSILFIFYLYSLAFRKLGGIWKGKKKKKLSSSPKEGLILRFVVVTAVVESSCVCYKNGDLASRV